MQVRSLDRGNEYLPTGRTIDKLETPTTKTTHLGDAETAGRGACNSLKQPNQTGDIIDSIISNGNRRRTRKSQLKLNFYVIN